MTASFKNGDQVVHSRSGRGEVVDDANPEDLTVETAAGAGGVHPSKLRLAEPYPEGTLVHHRGAIHSIDQEPDHPDGGLRGGRGAVARFVEQSDGTFEYEVLRDRDISGCTLVSDEVRATWWGSHHVNRSVRAAP